jgi:CO/xanthine dehydrogenase FAD-binding subunit
MEFDRPGDVADACRLLAEDPGATLLAGGTDVMVEVNAGSLHPEHVVALRHLEELKVWDGGFIGAGVTYDRMAHGSVTALAELSRTVGSPQIRAVGTIGGNVGTASPAGDTLPFLAAADAEVVLRSAQGDRVLHWDEFLTGPKRTARRDDELILGVRLPAELPPFQAFAKVGVRQAMVISVVSTCVLRRPDGATTVAMGAVGPTVLRARRAEAMISEEPSPSEAALAEFQRLVMQEVRPITDHRSTADYRRYAAGVIALRALERCVAT